MKRPKKGIEDRYMKFLNHVYDALKKDETASLGEISKKYGVSSSICSNLRKTGIIRYTLRGNEWIGNAPSVELVTYLRDIAAKEALNNHKKNKMKQQMPFEWQKPTTTVEKKPKYEYNVQPDSTAVSEFIDHHEQSLLPPPIKRVKTDKNDVKERMFQLRIFGINLFTVKY